MPGRRSSNGPDTAQGILQLVASRIDIEQRVGAEIGVFGGSGFLFAHRNAQEIGSRRPTARRATRWRSAKSRAAGWRFLPRHGKDHRFPPHAINYRANLWAMKQLGVKRIIGPTAGGSLTRDVKPGSMVVCDQLVDRTSGRIGYVLRRPDHHARQLRRPVLPDAAADRDRRRCARSASRRTSAGRSSSFKGRVFRRAPNRSGFRARAGK